MTTAFTVYLSSVRIFFLCRINSLLSPSHPAGPIARREICIWHMSLLCFGEAGNLVLCGINLNKKSKKRRRKNFPKSKKYAYFVYGDVPQDFYFVDYTHGALSKISLLLSLFLSPFVPRILEGDCVAPPYLHRFRSNLRSQSRWTTKHAVARNEKMTLNLSSFFLVMMNNFSTTRLSLSLCFRIIATGSAIIYSMSYKRGAWHVRISGI